MPIYSKGKYFHLLTVLLLGSLANPLFADDFHYTNLLVGERAAGLGGAYTGVSDDPSGLYYNPAGIVYSQGQKLSASVNSYTNGELKYKNVFSGQDYVRKTSSILPNFFGIVQPMGSGMFGLSYAVPDSINEDQDQSFSNVTISGIPIDRFIINKKKEDTTYLFGPSYAREFSNGLSLGVTLYYYQRKVKTINNQYIDYDDTWISTACSGAACDSDKRIVNIVEEHSESGWKPVLGLMYSPEAAKYSLGLTISQTSITSNYFYKQKTVKRYSDNATSVTTVDPIAKRKHPTEVKIGVAYFPSNKLMFTGDIQHYTAVENSIDNGIKDKRKSVTNFAGGFEYYPTSRRAYRGGFFTSYANTPALSDADSLSYDHLDIKGLSGSASFFTKNTSLTIGAVYSIGSGDGQATTEAVTQSLEYKSLALYLASSYSF